jgi:hypothetical protein
LSEESVSWRTEETEGSAVFFASDSEITVGIFGNSDCKKSLICILTQRNDDSKVWFIHLLFNKVSPSSANFPRNCDVDGIHLSVVDTI